MGLILLKNGKVVETDTISAIRPWKGIPAAGTAQRHGNPGSAHELQETRAGLHCGVGDAVCVNDDEAEQVDPRHNGQQHRRDELIDCRIVHKNHRDIRPPCREVPGTGHAIHLKESRLIGMARIWGGTAKAKEYRGSSGTVLLYGNYVPGKKRCQEKIERILIRCRRSTLQSRGMVAAAVLLAPLLSLSPWADAFSLQQHLSSHPALAKPIAIAFDPDLGRSAAESDSRSRNAILLPIRVSGLPPDSFLMKDRAEIRLIGRDGATLYRGRTIAALGYVDDFPVRTTNGGAVVTYQRIELPDKISTLILTQPVRLEMEYSMTIFDLEAEDRIPALNGDGSFGVFGRCQTKLDNDGDDIELGCEKPGAAPACTSVTPEYPSNGLRNPENFTYDPDYAPYSVHIVPDVMSQFDDDIKFLDLQGLAKYPVNRAQLDEACLILRSFRPAAHFTRRLVIPAIRLDDWIASKSSTVL